MCISIYFERKPISLRSSIRHYHSPLLLLLYLSLPKWNVEKYMFIKESFTVSQTIRLSAKACSLFALNFFAPKSIFAPFLYLPQIFVIALILYLPYFMVCPHCLNLLKFYICPILWFAPNFEIAPNLLLPYSGLPQGFEICSNFIFALFYGLPQILKLPQICCCPIPVCPKV